MLKLFWSALVCSVLVTVSQGCSVPTPPASASSSANTSSTSDVVGVEAFMRANQRPGLAVTVEGVVARVDPQQHTVALIDKTEFEECSATNCAALYLPVRWNGPMPKPEDIVRVRGEVAAEDGKFIFVAKEMQGNTPIREQIVR